MKVGLRVFRAHASLPEGAASQVDHLLPPEPEQGKDFDQRRGNELYTTYETQVNAIYNLYENRSQFGCGETRMVIDWRATQIAGNGVNFSSEDPATNEFLTRWSRENKLTGLRAWEFARTGEMEGKSLLYNEKRTVRGKKKILVKHLPWYRWQYRVYGSDDDGEEIDRIEFQDAKKQLVKLTEGQFVYARLGGVSSNRDGYVLNNTTPPVAYSLYHLVNLGRCLADLRDNNHLFYKPALALEAKDSLSAQSLRSLLFGRKTKGDLAAELQVNDRTFYIVDGKMYFVEPSGACVESSIKEATILTQKVSSDQGIPVHFLGMPNLMSNRATADDLHEMVNGTTMRQREAWKDAYTELARQACELDGGNYDLDSITVTMPVVMLSDIDRIVRVWLPLYQEGLIDKRSMIEKIPGVDPEIILERLEEQSQERQRQSQEMAGSILDEMNNRRQAEEAA